MRPELESIYQTAPIGLAVLDTELRFRRINERLAEINGLTVEAHGRSVRELLPDLAYQAEAVLQQVLQTGRPVRDLEIRGETPAVPGVQRIWREQITPLRSERGEIDGLSIASRKRSPSSAAQRRRCATVAKTSNWRWRPRAMPCGNGSFPTTS